MSAPNFRGGVSALNFLGGVWVRSWGVSAPNFWGGVCSKFSGRGVSAPNFRGGCLLQIFRGVSEIFWGGLKFFFLFFFNFFSPPKNPSGMHTHTHTHPPPRDGQCAAGTHPTGIHSCIYVCLQTLHITQNYTNADSTNVMTNYMIF